VNGTENETCKSPLSVKTGKTSIVC